MGRHVLGARETAAKLRKQGLKIEKVKQVVKVNGAELAQEAQRLAPVKTGNLKGSIRMQILGGGLIAEIEEHTEYGKYLELGTRFMNAQPYMTPATMKQRMKFISDVRKAVGK